MNIFVLVDSLSSGLAPWDEEASADSEAQHFKHSSYWNPANEVLRLARVKELEMKPAWNFTRKVEILGQAVYLSKPRNIQRDCNPPLEEKIPTYD